MACRGREDARRGHGMAHRNARLTPHGRLLLCERVEIERVEASARPPRPPASAARRRASGSPAGGPRARPASLDRSSRPLRIALRVVGDAPAPRRAPAPDEAPRPGLDRLAHGPRPGDRLPRPAAPPAAAPARARAARAGGALLLAARRRPRPPRHQEAGPHRRRRRQALRRPAPRTATGASAGTTRTWPSTTPRGWPTPRSSPTSAARRRPPSWSGLWPSSPATASRCGACSPTTAAATARAPSRDAATAQGLRPLAHAALPAADERQGGGLREDRPERLGLQAALRLDRGTDRRPAGLPALLQWLPTAWRPGRRHTAGQAHQVNNLVMQNS